MSLFFKDGNTTVDPSTVLDLLFTTYLDWKMLLIIGFLFLMWRSSQMLFSLKLKQRVFIYLFLQIVVIPFKAPDLSTVRYNDNDFVSYKQGYIKKAVFI